MKAVAFTEPGGPEVLRVLDLPEPHAGPGEVRVRVKAAGVQPFDAAVRGGWEPPGLVLGWPRVPGNEFAGVVDEGELPAGTEVLGFTAVRAAAEYIVVPASDVTPKPAEMPWDVAGGFTAGTQTASIALEALELRAGETLLVHGAAGSVGAAAVQLAKLNGAKVIGTASEANHDYLRELGALPVVYGEGLRDRVAPLGVDVVLDGAGGEALDLLLELVRDRNRILTLVDHHRAAELGVLVSKSGRSAARLAELAALYAKGDLRFLVRRAYPYPEAAAAHREIETGHGRGKTVLMFP
ncbi:NADP-dependent oxidoreductase [Amycolatopsis sp. CA-128772]|uniref:NADP-dependent oxidoreductase n=1 Tax=Amycolatopsis sp. CA-128772 TaxID=2073159 RepID=UPI000CD07381|nr:NADP-dependent oxidoreductase [Amycolatopsis sp. CA-128772]